MLFSEKIGKSSSPRTWQILLCSGCTSTSRVFSYLTVCHECEFLSHVTRVLWRGKPDWVFNLLSFSRHGYSSSMTSNIVLLSVGSILIWINQSDVHSFAPVASFREAQCFAQPCWDLLLYAHLIFPEIWISLCLIQFHGCGKPTQFSMRLETVAITVPRDN